MDFAQWLKKNIARSKLSNSQFIERSKISKAMVYLMLQGKRLPTAGIAAKVAHALQRDPADVLAFATTVGRPAAKE